MGDKRGAQKMRDRQRQRLVSDLDRRLGELLPLALGYRAAKLFKFVWRSELAERQTDVTAAIEFLKCSRRPAYRAIDELEGHGLMRRVTDGRLKRRKLLRVTRHGWQVLAAVTAKYSDIVVDHARRLDELKTNWVDLEGSRPLCPADYLPTVSALSQWSEQRGNEPIPTRFLDRIFVLDTANPAPEAFRVDYWGRGIHLLDNHDFAGQPLIDLRKCSSRAYWNQAAGALAEAMAGDGRPRVDEVRLKFCGARRTVQRMVIPDRPRSRVIVGSWLAQPDRPADRV